MSEIMWFKEELHLEPFLRGLWRRKNVFTQIFRQQGQVYREQKNRKTVRIIINGKGYFIKMHKGVGWYEIFKNLLQGRLPVLGAQQEWRAIQRLSSLGIHTAKLVGYGCRGHNPARLKSFVITEELSQTISLEDYCREWIKHPPSPLLKRSLIKEVAFIANTLHTNGINHRDFYLCHFLRDVFAGSDTRENSEQTVKLYVIDLHRAQLRKKTPTRWIIKDLAGLYFSALEIGLTQRDIFRFIKNYTKQDLPITLNKRKHFWQLIQRRAFKLYGKEKHRKFLANEGNFPGNWALQDSCHLLMGQQLFRKIPNKRWVMQGQWGTRQVVMKLFVNWRHAQQELIGYDALKNAQVLTPTLLHHGWILGEKLYALIFDFIDPAIDLNTAWQMADEKQRAKILHQLLEIMVKMHKAGLRQTDLHLHNFLWYGEQIYTLDPADVKITNTLTETERLKNLGLLLAQFPIGVDKQCEKIYRTYTTACGAVFTGAGLASLKTALINWRRYRLRSYQRKVMRNTSRLICRKDWDNFSICERAYDTAEMRVLLKNPDTLMESVEATVLKAGNSATVVKVVINGQPMVIKRYNIKNIWHALKRAFQPSRAAISWRNAHLLDLLNIGTPKPIAMLEKRFGPLRGKAYFISEYVTGTRLQDYFSKLHTQEEIQQMVVRIKNIFDELAAVKITHGDLKALNILLRDRQPLLLDLDAMQVHLFEWHWLRAFERDQKRFLQNWQEMPDILETFAKV